MRAELVGLLPFLLLLSLMLPRRPLRGGGTRAREAKRAAGALARRTLVAPPSLAVHDISDPLLFSPFGGHASGVVEGVANGMGFLTGDRAVPGLCIELHAVAPELNRFRLWRVEADQDLFGHWNARVTFGRIGCLGRTQRHDFDDEAATCAFIRACLRRRGTAEKRLSIRYRVVEASSGAQPLLRFVGLEEEPCSRSAPRGN